MLTYIIWAIVVYCAYRFLVGFVIPVFRATRQIRGQVKAFQENARQQQQSYYQQENNMYSNTGSQQQQPANAPTGKSGDYIDFEEIK